MKGPGRGVGAALGWGARQGEAGGGGGGRGTKAPGGEVRADVMHLILGKDWGET